MINKTEHEEREYLEEIKERLLLAIRRVDDRVKESSAELRQNKAYIFEHQSGMDEADMVAAEQSINRMAFTGESAVARKRKLMKLGDSPYFGRIDFMTDDSGEPTPVYIGIYTFTDESQRANLIYDWRAPISSMFYDFELGDAWYETPSGKIEGGIDLKRQYKIREGNMEFMIENAVNIQDDLLQKELSKSSDDKMKNIVATIQRDQNAVIRNETAPVMIIQGVAGSGKTSIALHRIAFLLYRFRETISAKDILIISPNKVFADYISNVLPELGEEQIPEMIIEELATDVLEDKYKFQSFFQQVSRLLEDPDEGFVERIQFKSSFAFLSKLNQYLIHLENNFFVANELRVGRTVVPSPFIHEKFKSYYRIPLLKRFQEVVKDIQQFVRNSVQRKLTGQEKAQIWQAVPQMIKMGNVFDLYKNFYSWIGREDLFRMSTGGVLEYSDVFPLIYCTIRLEGVKTYDHVKHLLVDEMQDYTPVQYSVLSRLFKCKKTILGDISQKVNPYSASSLEGIHQIYPQADTVKLLRSYRSTWEITDFAQRIILNPDLIPMERHGAIPVVQGFNSNPEEAEEIKRLLAAFKNSGHESLGIICKTQDQSETLHRELKSPEVNLLTAESTAFKNGIIITTVHLAKGLEFDEVIIPFVSVRNYRTDVDRSMLYIAVTRAMHRLTLLYTKEKSKFISD
ncbi:MAG TPA: UvrD-helicase domain-containing protein [Ohtaekwangia sp.]|nr:UvrD-helicase domain-containing protein [Ohtaekwangia sp.]